MTDENQKPQQNADHKDQVLGTDDKPGDGITQPPEAEIQGLMDRAANQKLTHPANAADAKKFDIELQIRQAKENKNPTLVAALEKLKKLGVDKNTILSLGASYEGPEQRWWQCPHCKCYIDAMVSIDGGPERLVFEDVLRCPGVVSDPKDPEGKRTIPCNTPGSEFDTVEGEFFDERNPKFKGLVRHTLHESIIKNVRAAKAVILGLGLFPSDDQWDKLEPRWPRELAAVLLGIGAYLGDMMHDLMVTSQSPGKSKKQKQKRKPKKKKGHPPLPGEGHGFGHEQDGKTGVF